MSSCSTFCLMHASQTWFGHASQSHRPPGWLMLGHCILVACGCCSFDSMKRRSPHFWAVAAAWHGGGDWDCPGGGVWYTMGPCELQCVSCWSLYTCLEVCLEALLKFRPGNIWQSYNLVVTYPSSMFTSRLLGNCKKNSSSWWSPGKDNDLN